MKEDYKRQRQLIFPRLLKVENGIYLKQRNDNNQ